MKFFHTQLVLGKYKCAPNSSLYIVDAALRNPCKKNYAVYSKFGDMLHNLKKS